MTEIINVFAGIFIAIGALLSLVTALGILRLPDVYTRNHAASKGSTLGVMSVLLGAFLYFYTLDGDYNSRLILAIVFIFITSPVAGHLISRAAYNTGIPMWEKSVLDELKDKEKHEKDGLKREKQ
ncbi:monovalent cation/H(+) antiporter subunit G [Falsibacillus pallidus]|uniref:Multisubunit sodium/proton antiporter MrpG subunit n=1 Tax=Falsibacillus pallidus TaxID=493781 RepID=A0A370G4G8_9BACI|nr:monovalent cation/H(+) antiporter subunit G [Falsibacillus pallidus]RDI36943.1 multisubunit sodium/proton antiporter MrpG subunit [Falsibacillus pallidus]